MARISLDPETKVVNEVFALIYAPGRTRDRFPENCVTVVESEALDESSLSVYDKKQTLIFEEDIHGLKKCWMKPFGALI